MYMLVYTRGSRLELELTLNPPDPIPHFDPRRVYRLDRDQVPSTVLLPHHRQRWRTLSFALKEKIRRYCKYPNP